ncbi:hypothetical protein ACS47_02440 [Bacillus cereus]|nr:hypothetical protein C623_0221690 [Bacillus thuringiensis serovar aizawai str. Hu4-2]ETE96056.1 hypothetical protein C621_0200675 [Bacillus thuringiensis serovar aizawai str. Leapi01]KMQ26117.1 hypothetical protein TU66_00100 [Bacillus cereus]MBB1225684.1 hypothetical protein [Klebsiella pneumoniae]MDR5041674.1 hypothetical protein [Bacillus thuringiensis]OIX12597.1 hypothetical protein BMT18_32355 [Bacillus thuringiensis serovar aizawai]
MYHPLGSSSKHIVLGTPTGEGAPQGLRGWGVRWMGSRGKVPLVGCGAKPLAFVTLWRDLAKPTRSRRAHTKCNLV